MKRTLFAVAAAAALAAGAAQAQQASRVPQSAWFGELGYSWMRLHDSGIGFDARPQAIRGIVGYNFHPNFAVEGMAAFGTNNDSDRGIDVKMQNSLGLFLKPKYDFNNIEVFGRVGYARTRIRASTLGVSASGTDNDFAWGAGASYSINPRTYVGLDYTRLHNKDQARLDGWTVSVGYRF